MDLDKHVGLIGCGRWGQNILRDLRQLGSRVTVVDSGQQARQSATEAGAISALTHIHDLGDVDGLVIATPARTHAGVVEAVAERGVPIFCEKPFTTNLDVAKRLFLLAPDRIFVMHVWRYHPGVKRLAQIARKEELGPVEMLRTTRTNWTSPRTDIDPIWTMAPHDLSIALEILGHIPTPRFAATEYVKERPVGMMAVLEDDVRFAFDVSTRYSDKRREVRLHCRDGVARLVSEQDDFVEISKGLSDVTITRDAVSSTSALVNELKTFLEFLCGGPPPRSSADDELRLLTAMLELRDLAEMEN